MRTTVFIIAAILTLGDLPAAAERLIVKKDGTSIWAETAKRVGDRVVYVDRAGGAEVGIPVSDLESVIPIARRGKSYDKKQVQKYVTRIEAVVQRHPQLMKQIRPILDQWKARLKAPADLSTEIARIREEFAASESAYAAYRKANVSLGLLAVKDVQGAFGERIELARDQVRQAYLDRVAVRWEELRTADPSSVDGVVQLRVLLVEVEQVDAARAAELKDELSVTGAHALAVLSEHAIDAYDKSPTLDTYLRSLGVLARVSAQVATTAKERDSVAEARKFLYSSFTGENPKIWLSREGHPLRSDDFELIKQAKQQGILVSFDSIEMDHECMLISKDRIRTIRYRQPVSLAYRLVFNRVHEGAEYGMVVLMFGKSGRHTHTIPLKTLTVRKGRADVHIREDFDQVPEAFEPSISRNSGKAYFYTYLAYRRTGMDGSEWRAVSPARGWVLDF